MAISDRIKNSRFFEGGGESYLLKPFGEAEKSFDSLKGN